MRPELEAYFADIFPLGNVCPDERLPPDYYIVYQQDKMLFVYGLVQDCGEYARHICNFMRYERAVQHAQRRHKQGLIG